MLKLEVETQSASRNYSKVGVKVYEGGWEVSLSIGQTREGRARATAVLSVEEAEQVLENLRLALEQARTNEQPVEAR